MIAATGIARPSRAAAADEGMLDGGLSSVPRRSIDRAYAFLALAMDAHQQGRRARLIQSFADSQDLGSTAFVYDNALAVLAFLARGKGDDLGRAMLLGDSFLYAQTHDPAHDDGRVRQAYWVGPFSLPFTHDDSYFVRSDGSVNLVGAPWFFQGSSVSDMSWVGIALARLFARTRKRRYLDGALRLAHWIVDHAFDTVGLGGYSFGVDGNDQRLGSTKRTEHNVDVYGFFTNLLAPLTGDSTWVARGRHALEFIERMWNPDGGFFSIGSNDGKTVDPSPVLEEVQSEAYLALADERYADALDWVKTNLVATDAPQSRHSGLSGFLRLTGVTFSDVSRRLIGRAGPSDPPPDPDAIWLEGTAHMVAALLARGRGPLLDLPTFHGDEATASEYAGMIALAQSELGRGQAVNGIAVPDGSGVVAASSVLNTGTGFSYFPNLHIGATSWFLIAAHGGNPYRL
jgi:hypothetical protein